jgi:hypothetical protein
MNILFEIFLLLFDYINNSLNTHLFHASAVYTLFNTNQIQILKRNNSMV